jgi:HK97 gp10 family phage protein
MLDLRKRVEGLAGLIAKFGALKVSARNKAIRKGLTVGARIVQKAAKANCKTKTGHGVLRKSIGQKVKIPRANPRTKAKAKPGYAVIGPRRKFKQQVGTYTRGPRAGQPKYEDPANIAHLVEFGHGGPHPAPAHPFMRPAWHSSKAKVLAAMREEVNRWLAEAPRA